MAKRQKMQNPQQHPRPPPIQQPGQHTQMRSGPDQPNHGSQPQVVAGPSHHYVRPRGPSDGPGRYPSGGNPSGGYNHPNRGGQVGGSFGSGPYPPQGPYPSGGSGPYPPQDPYPSGGSGPYPPLGPYPPGGSGNAVGAPNYPRQGGPYGGAAAARGSNTVNENYNQQYGRQQ